MFWLLGEIAAILTMTWVFWPALLLLSVYLFWCIVDEKKPSPVASAWSLLGIGVLLYLAGWYPNLSWQYWTLAAAIYLPIGSGYSIFRWKMFVRDLKQQKLELIEQRRERYNKDPGKYSSFEQYLKDNYYTDGWAPVANDNKGRIYIWILYWPISGASYIVSDMVTHVLREIYNMLGAIYDKITRSEWQEVESAIKR